MLEYVCNLFFGGEWHLILDDFFNFLCDNGLIKSDFIYLLKRFFILVKTEAVIRPFVLGAIPGISSLTILSKQCFCTHRNAFR